VNTVIKFRIVKYCKEFGGNVRKSKNFLTSFMPVGVIIKKKWKIKSVRDNSLLHNTTTCFDPLPGSSSGRITPRSRNVYNCKSQKNSSLQENSIYFTLCRACVSG
jgi:hypothetical protein